MAERGGRGRRLSDIAGSALTALLVFAAVPAVLVVLVGDPLAGGLGHDWGHAARVAMAVLAVVAWVAWAACCLQLTRSVVHHVRRGEVGLPAGASLTERIAARIAVGILAMMSFGVPLAVGSAGAGASSVPSVSVTAPATATATAPVSAPAPPLATAVAAYIVRPGDSLWTIAESQLGDGGDWTEIASLNLGHTMSDGRRFVDPSMIQPGWTLEMPPAPSVLPAAVLVAPPPAPPSLPVVAPNPTAAPPASATTTPTSAAAPSTPATLPTRLPSAGQPASPEAVAAKPSSLPELVVLGIGAVACAALARRARRRRLLQHLADPSGAAEPLLSAGAVDADVLLGRFHDVPALDAFERANCTLGHQLDIDQPVPAIRAICVTSFGVDFWLVAPGAPPPPGFDLVEDGRAWHLPHLEIDRTSLGHPCFAIVLPIGHDDEGTWLVPLRPGMCLPLLGPAAAHLWRAARRVQEAWSWADMVVVTEDPEVAGAEARRSAGMAATGPVDAFSVLYFGDPTALPVGVDATISVVTTSPVQATDLSVLVDLQGASLHPLGRTVTPNLVTPDAASLLDELLEPPAPVMASVAEEYPDDAPLGLEPDAAPPDASELGPGAVEVRLLTMTPRMDGLREQLAPNRERRAIELVAYLALHRPDVVTSDRLRTRVLGSGDADAAAKTLFNTATAARRAMGADASGAPLLPLGTRTGHYSVSPEVTIDVQRAAGLAAVGNALEDPELAMAHLRAALDLVESEPMANALSGYTWWESEGHGARIAAVLVHAACNLAALAVEAERFDVAQWGLEKARLVDPYSEALSRVAMQVAAAAGDADRLRREWSECQRRMDERDPGSSPSSRTERLYGELAQQVLA